MSCETNYAKMQKTTPQIIADATPVSTGYGNLNLLLRIRAANFWHESLVTLTDLQLANYCKQIIDAYYPNLERNTSTEPEFYLKLAFIQEPDLTDIYNYQWWLGYVIGPRSCTRDIAYFQALLKQTPNEEWSSELETALLEYQRTHSYIEHVTGYGCAETLKRLRLQE